MFHRRIHIYRVWKHLHSKCSRNYRTLNSGSVLEIICKELVSNSPSKYLSSHSADSVALMFFQSLFRVKNSNSENCWWYESLWLVDLLLPPKLELPKGSDPQQLIWMTGGEPESFAIFSFHRLLASFTVQNVKSHGTRVSVRWIT